MAVEILFPQIGASTDDGQVAEWLVKDGEAVTEGQLLFSVDAVTSSTAVEAPATGTLRIITRTGETYEIGTLLGYIE